MVTLPPGEAAGSAAGRVALGRGPTGPGAGLAARPRLARDLGPARDRGDHQLGAADRVCVLVRAVDGLRGVHPVPDPRGTRPHRLHHRRRGRGHRPDRAAGHRRRAHLVLRLRRLVHRPGNPTSRSWPPRSARGSCWMPPSSAPCWCPPWSPCSGRGTGGCPHRPGGCCASPAPTGRAGREPASQRPARARWQRQPPVGKTTTMQAATRVDRRAIAGEMDQARQAFHRLLDHATIPACAAGRTARNGPTSNCCSTCCSAT